MATNPQRNYGVMGECSSIWIRVIFLLLFFVVVSGAAREKKNSYVISPFFPAHSLPRRRQTAVSIRPASILSHSCWEGPSFARTYTIHTKPRIPSRRKTHKIWGFFPRKTHQSTILKFSIFNGYFKCYSGCRIGRAMAGFIHTSVLSRREASL